MIDGNIDVLELEGNLVDYISIEGELLPIGPKGDKGDPGDPGFSPQVDITKVGKATTLTIVDQQGTHQSVIYDGDGDMNKSVYDTDNDGIVDNAERVNNHTVEKDVPSDAVFTDTTYTAGTGIEITSGNIINNTQTSAEWGNITGDIEDQTDLQTALSGKADTGDIPTATSDLNNDSGFITKAVNDLTNYYTTSNTYTKTEVNTLIGNIDQFKIQVVNTLPVSDIDTHTIYFVPKTGTTNDVYDEYIYVNNAWEMIGNTQIDLTNYVQKTDYATSNTGGVIKSGFGLGIGSSGNAIGEIISYANYTDLDTHYFVSKGTLDNVFAGRNYETTNHKVTSISNASTDTQYPSAKCVYDNVSGKQDTLVSGTNIKTINSTSLLGSGDITIQASPEVAVSTTQPSNGELIWINPDEEYTGISGTEYNFKKLTGTMTLTYENGKTTGDVIFNFPSGYDASNTTIISGRLADSSIVYDIPFIFTDVSTYQPTGIINATISSYGINVFFESTLQWSGTRDVVIIITRTTDFD